MDIKDLKSAWDTYSSQEMNKHRLGKETIHELLKNQTKTLVDRIDRNIRIGIVVLLAYIAYVLLDDLYISKLLIKEPIKYPGWMVPLDVFSNALIMTTYAFFVIRYLKIRRNFSADLQLKELLDGILDTLKTYRWMYYLAVIILMINVSVSFTAGLYQGIKFKAEEVNGGIENLATSKILLIIGVGLLILIPMVVLSFLVLHWGFNKLYGRYMVKLNDSLHELNEPQTPE